MQLGICYYNTLLDAERSDVFYLCVCQYFIKERFFFYILIYFLYFFIVINVIYELLIVNN